MLRFSRVFLSIYFALYCLPFPIGSIPGTGPWLDGYSSGALILAARLGRSLFGHEFFTGVTGSGDTPATFIFTGALFAIALVAALLWCVCARRERDLFLFTGAFHYVRFSVAAGLYAYAWIKFFPPGQFGTVGPSRLIEEFGEASPMGLFWAFMAGSRSYIIFAGFTEFLAGTLLFFPRLVTLGALVSLGVMTNVFVLNLCYDVPVKLYSLHLILMSIFLAAPDFKRLVQFFLFNQPVTSRVPSLRPAWLTSFKARVLNGFLAISILLTSILMAKETFDQYADDLQSQKWLGVWRIENDPRSPDNLHWRKIAFDLSNRCAIRTAEGQRVRCKSTFNETSQRVYIEGIDDPKISDDFEFDRGSDDSLILTTLHPRPTKLRLVREAKSNSTLLNREFRWTTDLPFNR